MKNILSHLALLGLGLILGWQAHGYYFSMQVSLPATTKTTQEPNISDEIFTVDKKKHVITTPVPPASVTGHTISSEQVFIGLLQKPDIFMAINAYQQSHSENIAQAKQFKAHILSYLQTLLTAENHDRFILFTEAYLSQFYDDIDVLLLLAEQQQKQGYNSESMRSIQLALSYAYPAEDKTKVTLALQHLIEKNERSLLAQNNTMELIFFYEMLINMDLATPETQLRQAQLYIEEGHNNSAEELLKRLLQHKELGHTAQKLLADINPYTESDNTDTVSEQGIALIEHGSHFLIRARINEFDDVTLMLDTGASTTTLRKSVFDTLNTHYDFENKGDRLFNTANGVARSSIYRSEKFSIGEQLLESIDIAVMDFPMSEGIDGLLGMNVLKHYRFHINQDEKRLYLQTR